MPLNFTHSTFKSLFFVLEQDVNVIFTVLADAGDPVKIFIIRSAL